ncbi:hypothetical protein DMC30DRAFT_418773 [Rhodotorula diobovata]|uniref:Uncharacterized protein n=1 Tax=Rhodotorula diobovata TaxID=5288 RepID=A0A5C5FPF6_9BASI|nr:hypothetical protein DMC30DRAFT_418773 [Rhodotorula diobovata]
MNRAAGLDLAGHLTCLGLFSTHYDDALERAYERLDDQAREEAHSHAQRWGEWAGQALTSLGKGPFVPSARGTARVPAFQ